MGGFAGYDGGMAVTLCDRDHTSNLHEPYVFIAGRYPRDFPVGHAILMLIDFVAVFIAAVCDLVSKARRQSQPRTSRGYRQTVDKLARYFIYHGL